MKKKVKNIKIDWEAITIKKISIKEAKGLNHPTLNSLIGQSTAADLDEGDDFIFLSGKEYEKILSEARDKKIDELLND